MVDHVRRSFTRVSSIAIGVNPIPSVSLKYASTDEKTVSNGNSTANTYLPAHIRPMTPPLQNATISHCIARAIKPRSPVTGLPQKSAVTKTRA